MSSSAIFEVRSIRTWFWRCDRRKPSVSVIFSTTQINIAETAITATHMMIFVIFRSPTNSSRIIFGSQSISTAAAALQICEKTESMKYPGSSRKSRDIYLNTSETFPKNIIVNSPFDD